MGVSLLQWMSIMVILLTLFEGLKAYRRGERDGQSAFFLLTGTALPLNAKAPLPGAFAHDEHGSSGATGWRGGPCQVRR